MQTPDRNARTIAALAGAVALLAALLLAPPAPAKTKFEVKGRGYGHGVGMSQWGAYGYAKRGAGYKKILGHYYKGTDVSKAGSRQIKVLLSTRSRDVAFSGAKRACGRQLSPSKTYRARLKGSNVRLEKASGSSITSCGDALKATPRKHIEIGGDGTYRGKLVARSAAGALNVINAVGLDDYIQGVIPGEVPASWPSAALRAQAVAARSYALATDANGAGFDQYDDTRSQVYAGVGVETPSTNKAARQTDNEVVKYKGEVIPTFFFSSSGGRTENVEYGFSGGTPQPYLKSVKDPYDDASPLHTWRETFSRKEMEDKLGSLVEGKLQAIKVTKRGASPRIVTAKVVGSNGSSKVSGSDLRTRLGLYSTWASFRKIG
jgi:stage II sporulation protein D